MSIQTEILNQNPTIVIHSISGKLSEVEAKKGAITAIEVISSLIVNGEKIDLILNMKNYIFDNIDSHRIWSLGFKEHRRNGGVRSCPVRITSGPKDRCD